MKTMPYLLIFLLTLIASFQLSAEEKILYKWTDDKNEIHYTERMPKGGIKYTKIRTRVDSGSISAAKLPVKPMNQAKEEPKKGAYGTWKEENCTIANQNLEILQEAARIGVDDGLGGKRLMTDEEKAEKVSTMEKQRDKYCIKSEEEK